jgi:putative hydrolase of the HAD superfamily
VTPHGAPSPLGCQLHEWQPVLLARAGRRGPAGGVVFDLDDTLYPHEAFLESGFMAVARHVERHDGLPAAEAFATMRGAHRRRATAGTELQALCAQHALGDRVVELRDVFRAHRPILRLPPATAAVLGRLRTMGWRLVVLTNGAPDVQRRKVTALGVAPLVDAVLYADAIAPGGKPAAVVFDAALARLRLPAARCVCVGDNTICDVAGARARGLRTVWLPPPGTPPGSGGADARIASLRELPALLPRLLELVTNNAA